LNIGKASGLTGVVVHRDIDILNRSITSKELPQIVRSVVRLSDYLGVINENHNRAKVNSRC